MGLWTYATVKRAEYDPHRRVRLRCKRHECCPIQFNLAIVHNCATQPDGCCVRDCITTALDKKSQAARWQNIPTFPGRRENEVLGPFDMHILMQE